MDINLIRRLVKLVETSGISELEIDEKESRIYISKYGSAAPGQVTYTATPAPQQAAAAPVTAASAPATTAAPTPPSPSDTGTKLHEIKSPIVGTFYRSPAPDADAYVKVGDRVNVGSVLCIVEAMKLMNEIESDISGTIEKILADNAKPVEYGQVLFLVKPD
ncbi:MAG: acetyl-CoA carboxylase biotin carboxyl carrier protein [Ignavibacteriales bacterium]|jgi:biotin carboxyl carrier protein|nr:MAG: acetyl-CoA carboxylase biotin carboxyl carrier protein [Ignavibacteriaceae bacterium]MBW7873285.1 acetyl-CoA carboxylase biotin carboxyl carrier protein [Ignavibacteria bacterium]MCZ2143023.1 acetyl-CoA carboxylase biotin carboxyl carrier protein [Ignavibacteriales bacterium]OQY77472.1 MAG: acetyl-CoA carboxylase, biotin carboxyl carrier protein [Ignavibacteriales bacterium UTCHB3]MBV6444713.1 Biotin carboxyl carrier protein of acetyl-CoA carboxylase [Ignavibacteriaceae bacterium]